MYHSLAEVLLDAAKNAHVKAVEKPWGIEYVLRLDDALVKVICVDEGGRTSLQHHERKREVIFVLDGDGEVAGTDDSFFTRKRPSDPYLIAPHTRHRSVGPLVLLEITTDDDDDVVRHEDDYGRES